MTDMKKFTDEQLDEMIAHFEQASLVIANMAFIIDDLISVVAAVLEIGGTDPKTVTLELPRSGRVVLDDHMQSVYEFKQALMAELEANGHLNIKGETEH
jgi:uncharacterized membrane protein